MTQEYPDQTQEVVKAMLFARIFCERLGLNFDDLNEEQQEMVVISQKYCGDRLFTLTEEKKREIEAVSDKISEHLGPVTMEEEP